VTAIGDLAARRVVGLPTYRPGKPSTGSAAGKLSSNESPLGAGPSVSDALRAAAGHPHRYPDDSATRHRLAAELGVTQSQLLLTNGSDELCYLIAQMFLAPGKRAVLGDPCYAIDNTVSLLSGADVVRVPLVRGAHDLRAMAAAAIDASALWLPSPHNPTGVAVSHGELVLFLREVPADCLVVLDQAYHAFSSPGTSPDVAALLAQFPNLLVQRTMSKDWALAGLRVGYAIAAPEIIGPLSAIRPPFSVNSFALAGLSAAVGQPAWQAMSVARVREGRALLQAELDSLGVEYYPSEANFVLVHIDHSELAPYLLEAGLSVRSGADLGMPGWIRITIGWAPTMATLIDALRKFSSAVPNNG